MRVLLLCFFLIPVYSQEGDVDELNAHRNQYNQTISEIQQDMQTDLAPHQAAPNDEYIAVPEQGNQEQGGGQLESLRKKYIPEIEKNPLANKSKEEVQEIILTKAQGSAWETIFTNNPRILAFVVDFLQHDTAFIYFSSIIAKPDKLRKYFYCFIIVFLISMYWNYKLPKNVSFFKKVSRKLVFSLSALTINLLSFYMIFKEELTPTLKLFSQHFF